MSAGEGHAIHTIGLISGTSMDGIDAVAVDLFEEPSLRVVPRAYLLHPYPPEIHAALVAVCRADAGSALLACRLHMVLGEIFAEAARVAIAQAGWTPDEVLLIGSHGQTTVSDMTDGRLAGWRSYSTQQLGHPAVIAERTGITVVADFRARDIAAGGRGAPLVSLLDALLFGAPGRSRALINLGGIANVTLLPADGDMSRVIGFDTGPANMPMDAVMRLTSDGRERYDRDGALAARGTIDAELLTRLLRHPFVVSPPPKATGSEDFGDQFAADLLASYPRLSRADLLATLARFAAEAVAAGIHTWYPGGAMPDEVLVTGGGVHNRALMANLVAALAPAPVRPLAAMEGVVDAKEAILFAVLGYITLRGSAGNLPSVTGAAHPVPLGSITPGRLGLDLRNATGVPGSARAILA
jgi:anhydro-N-acetylmuramic acid kinase